MAALEEDAACTIRAAGDVLSGRVRCFRARREVAARSSLPGRAAAPFGAPATPSVPLQSRFQVPPPAPASATGVGAILPEDRTMAVLLHLSTFGGIVIPGLGLLLPLILWLTNRQRPAIDAVGKEVMNDVILSVIATVASVLLVHCLIGSVLLLALIVATIMFPIIGAVKASNGEFFRYPLPFRILR